MLPPQTLTSRTLVATSFLERSIAAKWEACRYVLVASLSIMIWDVCTCYYADWHLLSQSSLSLVGVVFVLSRVSALGTLLSAALITTSPHTLTSCNTHLRLALVILVVNRASTSFLFFARVRAVCTGRRVVVSSFTALWLLVITSNIPLALLLKGYSIGPTKYCMVGLFHNSLWFVVPVAVEGAFDFCVWIAVVSQLKPLVSTLHTSRLGKWGARPLSRRMLKDSQLYLILTALIRIPELVSLFLYARKERHSPGAAPMQYAVIYLDVVVVNILSAKIYRNMKLGRPGLLSEHEASTTTLGLEKSGIAFARFENEEACGREGFASKRRRSQGEGAHESRVLYGM